jgi:predicted TIM-barrel fold metal-dependent hydrolase
MIDGIEVIDFHGHTNRNDRLRMLADAERVKHSMDAAGIDRACVFHTGSLDGSGNEQTVRYAEANPDRFIPFAFTSPILGMKAVRQLERAVDELHCVAIKLYPPRAPWPLNDAHWFDIYSFAHERSLAIIFHTGAEDHAHPRFVGEIAPRFPHANFVAGHSGNIASERRDAIAAANDNPNIFLETCSTFRTPGAIEELVEGAGADRVLFGSDQPLMDPRPQLGKILTAAISDRAKRQALGANARRLLG